MHRKKWLSLVGMGLVLGLLHISSATIIYEVYKVRKGDTLESVAKRYGIEVADLKAANKSLETESLKPNQYLTIPLHKADKPTPQESAEELAALQKARQAAAQLPDSSATQAQIFSPASDTSPPPNSSGTQTTQQQRQTIQQTNRTSQGQRVGVLGVVRRSGARIRKSPDARAAVVYSCSKGTQLVIVKQGGAWYGVMMIDGSTCWIEQAAVDLTEVELVQNTQAQPGIGRPDIVQAALAWLGTPYKYGGTSARGIDCSALVMNVYRQFGVRLPRTAREQYQVGQVVTWDQLLPGDRLYFTSSGGAIDHTGLYMGDGQFVHASGRRGMVGIDSLGDASYWRMFVGAKR